MLSSAIQRRVRTCGRTDHGFTLTEVLVTLFVISAVLLGLITVQVRALASVGLAKERQQATALANRTMEQIRALPYDTVAAGLRLCDTTGDSNISAGQFQPSYDSAVNEPIVTNSTACTGAPLAPLYPHIQNGSETLVGSTQYRVRTYVSRAGATAADGYWLTAIVDWSTSNTGGQSKLVAVRSRLYSPTGCSSTSTATRPFAGPCQAFFYSDAGTSAAGITVQSTTDGTPLVTGSDVVRLEAKLPSLSARTQNEQIVSAQSVSATSKLAVMASTDTEAGGQAATSAADTDPASGIGNSPAAAANVSYSGASTLSSSSSPTARFSIDAPNSSSGSTYSTTQAGSSPACKDDAGTALVSNQACSSASVTPDGTYRARMDVTLPGGNVAGVDLATIATTSTPTVWRAYGARAALPLAPHCAATSGIGCVASGVRRALGVVEVGKLPGPRSGDTVQAGFSSMARLSGLTAVAGSESGITPGSAVASRGATTLDYWNGSGYTSVTLGNSAGTFTLGTASGTYRLAGVDGLTVTMTGTVVVEPVGVATSGTAPCQATACTSTATVGAVRINVQYDLVDGSGAPIGSFLVSTDLGSTVAQTSYKAAPSA